MFQTDDHYLIKIMLISCPTCIACSYSLRLDLLLHVTLLQTRNLVYMVQRRERLKKQLLKNQAELLELKYKFLEETGSDELSGLDEETVKEEEMDEMVSIESSDDEPDSPYIRQTRYALQLQHFS